MTETDTITLIAKPEAKTWHIKAAGTDLALCGIVVSAARDKGSAQIEEGIDARAERHANRPVCGNCRDQFKNRTTTTEEVTMSTTAASASNEAKPDPKEKDKVSAAAAAGQSRSRTSTRSTAASTRAAAAPKTDDGPQIPADLEKTLVAQVKAMKPKPELKAPPSGSYTIIKSSGVKIGGFRPQSRKGVCVMFAVSPTAVKAALKGATVEPFDKNVYKSRAYITTEAQAQQAVKLLAETAKQAAAK